jgi:hypothetical protein
MINQLEKIKCGYFECKKDNFSDIIAHAKDSHVDNPISHGKRKLDSVNQFKRPTYVNPSPCFTVWFCLMLCLFWEFRIAIFSLNRKVVFPITFRLYCRFWEAVNGCYFVTSNVFEQLCVLLKIPFWSFMHLFQYLFFDNSLLSVPDVINLPRNCYNTFLIRFKITLNRLFKNKFH